jgi:hypothetical protein
VVVIALGAHDCATASTTGPTGAETKAAPKTDTTLPVIALLIALGSLGVSLVTAARPLVQRPSLALEYDGESGPLTEVGDVLVSKESDYIKLKDNGVVEHYLRLRVVNRKRWHRVVSQTATNVQILASTRSGSGRVGLDYRPLQWSSASPKPDDPVVTLPSIPIGVERHIDVALLTGGKAHLRVWPQPSGGGHDVPAGEQVEVRLTVTCDEGPARFWTVVVKRDDAASNRRLLDFVKPPGSPSDEAPRSSVTPSHGPIES